MMMHSASRLRWGSPLRALPRAPGSFGDFHALIDGRLTSAESEFSVTNPATGKELAKCPEVSVEQVDEAVKAAGRALRVWRSVSVMDRKELVSCISEAMATNADKLAHWLTLEQGKPLHKARGEVLAAASLAKSFARLEIPVEVLRENSRSRVELHHRPVGVAAAIVPWNFPLSTAFAKVFPSLIAGCPIIVKPSPHTPLSTCLVGEIVKDLVLPGLLQVLPGRDSVGRSLVKHPGVAKVTFTGSVSTGKAIQAACADTMKRTTLELGGNDAAIVCRDANPVEVAPRVFAAAMANSGQVCIAIKRVFVHEDSYEAFCSAIAEEARKARFGDGMDSGIEYGPLCNLEQLEKVRELVEDARSRGARVIVASDADFGGKSGSAGFFHPPTIVADVDDSFRIVKEEQFGPVLPILRYSTEDEAVARANDSEFGLGGSVWSRDVQRATDLAHQLECGMVWVNQHMGGGAPGAPFGGFKQSGMGREGGMAGLLSFTEPQTIAVMKDLSK